jgi:PhnB protein
LFFAGNCAEAVRFYEQALGAKVTNLVRFKDSPDKSMIPPGRGNDVMHARFTIGQTNFMASDNPKRTPTFDGFSLSLNTQSEADARRYFAALADGGNVTMTLEKTFFSPLFGMVEDKFGIGWMIHLQP